MIIAEKGCTGTIYSSAAFLYGLVAVSDTDFMVGRHFQPQLYGLMLISGTTLIVGYGANGLISAAP